MASGSAAGPGSIALPVFVNIEAVIAALGGRFDTNEAGVVARVLREYDGTVPDALLISEAALARSIHGVGGGKGWGPKSPAPQARRSTSIRGRSLRAGR